jgi:Holliday junction resolvase RusA-like endonuclease
VIELPFPPSTNRLWRVVGNRAISSKHHREWVAHAGAELLVQRIKKHTGPVAITIELGLPDRRRRDIDNCCKPLLDLLAKHRVIEDDCAAIVRELRIKVGEGFGRRYFGGCTVQRTGRAARGAIRTDRCTYRHSGQVSGPGKTRGHLLDDDVSARRCTTWNGVSLQQVQTVAD